MFKHGLVALAAMGMAILGFPATGALALTVPVQTPAVETGSSSLLTDVRSGGGGGYHSGSGHYGRPRAYAPYHGYHGYRGYPRYYPRYHGYRCNAWNNNCRHYYHGYWYQNPWWTYPAIGVGIGLGAGAYYYGNDYYDAPPVAASGSRHVRWCMDRYRSYNPRTNTWVSYSGRVNQCISPYGP